MQEICRLSIFYSFSHSYLMVIFVKILAFCNFSKYSFTLKLLKRKPRVRAFLGSPLTAQKLRLFLFQKFNDCDWSQKHVTISYIFKMATVLKTDQINEEYLN